jgi:hypothetical protein
MSISLPLSYLKVIGYTNFFLLSIPFRKCFLTMARCRICDWSPDTQSLYFLGLSMPDGLSRTIDPVTGEVECNCFSAEEDIPTEEEDTIDEQTGENR